MSAKTSVKTIASDANGKLFTWVAALTGSKNALKGAGFFIGAALLQLTDFRSTLWLLAGLLAIVFIITLVLLPTSIGKSNAKAKFSQIFSQTPATNWLAATAFFCSVHAISGSFSACPCFSTKHSTGHAW